MSKSTFGVGGVFEELDHLAVEQHLAIVEGVRSATANPATATFAVWYGLVGAELLFVLTLTIAVFVVACPGALGLAAPRAAGFLDLEGYGARASVEGRPVLVGSSRLMDEEKVALGALAAEADRLKGVGRTAVHVAEVGTLLGLIAIADAVRPSAGKAVAKLRARGIELAMLTADNEGTARRIAAELGITMVLADLQPGLKAEKVRELRAQGKRVGMVGDGVNDSTGLTQADVGFTIGAGTDVAVESADVVLIKSDPHDVVGAIELSRATLRKMHQNPFWSVTYNVVAFPIATGVFCRFTFSSGVAALAKA